MPNGGGLDELQIKIDAEADKASKKIDLLLSSFNKLKKAMESDNADNAIKQYKAFSTEIDNVAKSINKIDGTKLANLSKIAEKVGGSVKKMAKEVEKATESTKKMDDISKRMTITRHGGTQSETDEEYEARANKILEDRRKQVAEQNKMLSGNDGHGVKLKDVYAQQQKAIQDQIDGLGKVKDGTNSVASGMDKTASRAEYAAQKIKELRDRFSGENFVNIKPAESLKDLERQIRTVESTLNGYYRAEDMRVKSGSNLDIQEFTTLEAKIVRATKDLEILNTAYNKLSKSHPIKQMIADLGKFGSKAKAMTKPLADFAKSTVNSFGKGAMSILKYAFGIRTLFVLFNRLRAVASENIKNLSLFSPEINASVSSMISSLNYLKNAFGAAFAPIISVVAPLVSTFVDMIADALNAVGRLISALTGKGFAVQAVKKASDYAASLDNSTKNAADNAKDMAKAINQLQGFDKLNNLTSNKGSSGGTGGTGGSGTGGSSGDVYTTTEIESDILGLADRIKKAWETDADFSFLGDMLATNIITALDSIDWERIKNNAGKFGKGIATFLNGIFENETNSQTIGQALGRLIGEGINTAFTAFDSFVTNINTHAIGSNLSQFLQRAFETIDFGTIFHSIFETGIKVTDFVSGFIDGIDFTTLPATLFEKIKEVVTAFQWDEYIKSLFHLVLSRINAVAELAQGIVDLFKSAFESAKELVKAKFSEIFGDGLFGLLGKGSSTEKITLTVDGKKTTAFDTLKKAWEKIKTKTATLTGKASNKNSSTLATLKKGWDAVVTKTATLTGKAQNKASDVISALKSAWAALKDKTVTLIGKAKNNDASVLSTLKSAWQAIVSKTVTLTTNIKGKALDLWNWITGKKEEGGAFYGGAWHNIPQYASGGIPSHGSMFIAGENGAEAVGHINGRTEVLNRSQMASVMFDATYRAVKQAMSNSGTNTNVNVTLEGDAKGMFKVVKKEADNYRKMNGKNAFVY